MNPATTPMTIKTVELTENLSKSKMFFYGCRATSEQRTLLWCGLFDQNTLALKHDLAARHGCDHANILQFIGFGRKGIGVNHYEISQFANFKTADRKSTRLNSSHVASSYA